MALQAVGWLSAKFGVDIAGQPKKDKEKGDFEAPTHQNPNVTPISQQLGKFTTATLDKTKKVANKCNTVLDEWGNAVFGGSEGETGAQQNEDGLPESRNWYAYNSITQRWEPTPEAPDDVKAEYQQKMEEHEREISGKSKFPDPPPMMPMGGAMMQRKTDTTAAYAVPDFFSHAPPPPAPAPSTPGNMPAPSASGDGNGVPFHQPPPPTFGGSSGAPTFSPAPPPSEPQAPFFQPSPPPPPTSTGGLSPPPPPFGYPPMATGSPPKSPNKEERRASSPFIQAGPDPNFTFGVPPSQSASMAESTPSPMATAKASAPKLPTAQSSDGFPTDPIVDAQPAQTSVPPAWVGQASSSSPPTGSPTSPASQ